MLLKPLLLRQTLFPLYPPVPQVQSLGQPIFRSKPGVNVCYVYSFRILETSMTNPFRGPIFTCFEIYKLYGNFGGLSSASRSSIIIHKVGRRRMFEAPAKIGHRQFTHSITRKNGCFLCFSTRWRVWIISDLTVANARDAIIARYNYANKRRSSDLVPELMSDSLSTYVDSRKDVRASIIKRIMSIHNQPVPDDDARRRNQLYFLC